MPRPCILFVHGRKPKPPPELYRPQLWRCLLEGVRRADPQVAESLAREPDLFRLVGWHDLFYQDDRDIGPDLEAIDRVIAQRSPSADDIAEAGAWPRRVKHFVYHMGDRFPRLVEAFADAWIRETVEDSLRYLENRDGLATQVCQRLHAALARCECEHTPPLIIGHSLGSVIAFDALWERTHAMGAPVPVDLFLTLGSPLGTRFVCNRLLGSDQAGERRFPHGIRHWLNLATVGDLAALDPTVEDDFAPMRRAGLLESLTDNTRELYGSFRGASGLNVHRSYGYLVLERTGAAIAAWWRRRNH